MTTVNQLIGRINEQDRVIKGLVREMKYLKEGLKAEGSIETTRNASALERSRARKQAPLVAPSNS